MATSTSHLGLVKPAYTDAADVAVINNNMDTIDTAISNILPVITGSTNNSGYTIATGHYFEANGSVYKATASIGVGSSWSGSASAVSGTALNEAVTSLSSNIAKVQNGLAYIVGNTNTTGSTLAVGMFVYVKGHSSISEGLRKVTASISANGSLTTNNTTACSEGGLNVLNSKSSWFDMGEKTVIGGSETEPPSDYFTYPEGTNEIFVLCGIDDNLTYSFSWIIPVGAIPSTNTSFYNSWYGGNSYNNAVLQLNTLIRRVYIRYLSVNGISKNSGRYKLFAR